MEAERTRLKRFTVGHRLWHWGLAFLFFLMGYTGLAWMYIETAWGQMLAAPLGGYQGALYWHRIAGLIFVVGFFSHVVYSIALVDWKRFPKSLFNPDMLIFQWADIKGFFQHLAWVFGLAKAPRFDRWSWWEKFDYWAVWWGLIIVGVTGLILYDPVLSSDFMPGWLFNVALWVHRIEAVMAMAHIFTIHFFVENFRPKALPFNAAMFDGTMTLEDAREEHPEWVARLEREGKLEAALAPEPPVPLRILYFMVGYAIIAFGLFLLVFALMNFAALTLL